MLPIEKLQQKIQGKKVAFIGAGVSHKTLIREFVELGAHVTLCDQKKSVEEFGDYAATIKELGIDPTDEQIAEMAASCARACGGAKGSAKVLHQSDMEAIYKMLK